MIVFIFRIFSLCGLCVWCYPTCKFAPCVIHDPDTTNTIRNRSRHVTQHYKAMVLLIWIGHQFRWISAHLLITALWEMKLCSCCWRLKSLRPSDATWRHRSGSTLAQVLICYLTAPNLTRNNVDISSMGFCDTHLGPNLLEVPKISFRNISLKNTPAKQFPCLSVAMLPVSNVKMPCSDAIVMKWLSDVTEIQMQPAYLFYELVAPMA